MVYCASHARRHHPWRIYSSPTCRTAPRSWGLSSIRVYAMHGIYTLELNRSPTRWYKTPPEPPAMSRVSLAIPRCPDHHDSPVSMASQYRHAPLVLSQHTRSRLMKIIRPMTPLRQRMLEDMQIRNSSPHTVDASLRRVAQCAKHCHTSPDR